MYNNPFGPVASGGVGGFGGLAMTGQTGNPLWIFLTAFALIALGSAILRMIPRRQA